jgi:cation diffusion facilitator CzcD-associated flavoprotein CzcO
MIAVIGAGPAGMAAAKELAKLGLEFHLFDKLDAFGGIWRLGLSGPLTKNTYTNSPYSEQSFADHPISKPRTGDFLHWTEALAYLENVAAGLSIPHLSLRTTVTAVRRSEKGWSIETPSKVYEFSDLIVATGLHNRPHELPKELAGFEGNICHVHAYKDPGQLSGRKVLVVGGARPSTCDTAMDASLSADRVVISTRSPILFWPVYWRGRHLETFMDQLPGPVWYQALRLLPLIRFALGRQHACGVPFTPSLMEVEAALPGDLNDVLPLLVKCGRVEVRPGIASSSGSQVTFTNGQVDEFDSVVVCNGYRNEVPLLGRSGKSLLDLRYGIYDREFDNLFFVGLVHPLGGHWDLFECQAASVGRFIAARRRGDAAAKVLRGAKARLPRALPCATPRYPLSIRKKPYMEILKKWTDRFCQ